MDEIRLLCSFHINTGVRRSSITYQKEIIKIAQEGKAKLAHKLNASFFSLSPVHIENYNAIPTLTSHKGENHEQENVRIILAQDTSCNEDGVRYFICSSDCGNLPKPHNHKCIDSPHAPRPKYKKSQIHRSKASQVLKLKSVQ